QRRARHPGQQEVFRRLREALRPQHLALLRPGLHRRTLLPRSAQGDQRRGREQGEVRRRPPAGLDPRRPARPHEDGRAQQSHPERLRSQGGAGGRQAPEHRRPHLPERLPVLDLQAGRVPEGARVRPERSSVQVLRLVAGAAARAVLVLWAIALWTGPAAAAETIRVGFMSPLTGIFAQAGKDMLDGLKMALEQVNYQAGGRKIELIEADTEGNSATAIAKYRKLVDHDKIHVMTGVLLVNVGNSLVPLIER